MRGLEFRRFLELPGVRTQLVPQDRAETEFAPRAGPKIVRQATKPGSRPVRDLGAAPNPFSEAMSGRCESSGCFFEAIVVHPRLGRWAIFGCAGEENGWTSAVDNSGSISGPNSSDDVRLLCVCCVRHAFLVDFGGPAGVAGRR